LALAVVGVCLMALDWLPGVLAGMALVAVGTFLAQALATGFVARAAMGDRAAASGLYLACYFSGGLIGAIVLGQIYTAYGWSAMSVCVMVMLAVAGILARNFDPAKT
jgi:predicted MFS family arabinose efflux permease